MRKYMIGGGAVIACLVGVLLFRGCNAETVELALRLQASDVREVVVAIDTNTAVTAKEGEQRVKSRIEIPWTFRVDAVDVDGALRMTVTYGKVTLGETVTKGGKTTIPFQTMAGPNPLKQISDLVQAESFTVEIAPDGTIRSVSGIDAIVEKLKAETVFPDVAGRKTISKRDREKLLEGFLRQFAEPAVRSLMQIFLSVYPGEPVTQGSTWTRKGPGDPGRALREERQITLMKHDGDTSTLALTSTFASDDPDRVELNSARIQGTALLDAATGWVMRLEINHESTYLYRSEPDATIREHALTIVETAPW